LAFSFCKWVRIKHHPLPFGRYVRVEGLDDARQNRLWRDVRHTTTGRQYPAAFFDITQGPPRTPTIYFGVVLALALMTGQTLMRTAQLAGAWLASFVEHCAFCLDTEAIWVKLPLAPKRRHGRNDPSRKPIVRGSVET
jgi:hypothetical protein